MGEAVLSSDPQDRTIHLDSAKLPLRPGSFLFLRNKIEADKKENTMDKTTKTILIVLGSLLLVCACGASILFATGAWSVGKIVQWADQNTTENPQEVAQTASGIASFDVPEGFSKQYGMKLGDFTMVAVRLREVLGRVE